MGVHAYSTIGDYKADKKAGYKTFATVFGKRSAAFFAFLTFTMTLFFLKIPSLINPILYYYLRYGYLGFCSALFFITVVFPYEKPIKWLVGGVFTGFILTAIIMFFISHLF
jgi:4-hydroxybenzoate polyprenyltransferase